MTDIVGSSTVAGWFPAMTDDAGDRSGPQIAKWSQPGKQTGPLLFQCQKDVWPGFPQSALFTFSIEPQKRKING